MSRLIAAGLLLTSAFSWAQDYLTYKMLSTAQQPFHVYIDSRSNRPAGLDLDLVQRAVERSWATWNAVSCAYPKVQSLGRTGGVVPNPAQSYDDFSVTPVWMLTNDADAEQIFGNTELVMGITLPRAYAGVLQTCDIYFNGANFAWSTDAVTGIDMVDVETVALHEAGHCLGLGHFGPPEAVMEQVVERGQNLRSFHPEDVQKLCSRYPLQGESASPCFTDGGCAQRSLKCLSQPVTNGLSLNLCTRGCVLGANAVCDLPLACQASSSFLDAGLGGACLLPGSIVTQVGRPCATANDCGNSFGLCQPPVMASGSNHFWVGGYCTQSCGTGQPACPAGSTCQGLANIGERCLQSCRVGLADCRVNYACAQVDDIGTSGVCVPRCYADADCDTAFTCRTCDGLCVPRQNVSGQIGDLCQTATTCGPGQTCRATDPTSIQKQCTTQCSRGCGVCPTQSTCTPGPQGELFCLRNCTGPGTCGQGMRCADTAVGKSCQPACQPFDGGSNCPVGQRCCTSAGLGQACAYIGECYTPQGDGGCLLCTQPDGGAPITPGPKDAGPGPGGSGGCGCASPGSAWGVAMLGLLGLLSRRRSWPRY